MKPIYDAYKDSGFTVVGVLGQFKSREQALDRLVKEAHPWLTLIEEGAKESIWLPYGIANSGGKTFLVDEEGLLVAFDPSKDELQEFLKKSIRR